MVGSGLHEKKGRPLAAEANLGVTPEQEGAVQPRQEALAAVRAAPTTAPGVKETAMRKATKKVMTMHRDASPERGEKVTVHQGLPGLPTAEAMAMGAEPQALAEGIACRAMKIATSAL